MTAVATQTMTGGEAVVRSLAGCGVDLLFGIPGTHTLEMHRHLTAAGIQHVTPRHEQGAAYAADGYARVSGRPGVVLATSGPGVMNTATAVATAYADSVPVLVVSPSMPTGVEGRDTGYLHESKDQGAAMGALVAYSGRPGSPAEAASAVHEAFARFASGRPRPAHIQVPVDVLEASGQVTLGGAPAHDARGLDHSALEKAAELLSRAAAPAIVLGGGARGASQAATRLAERLHAPVITTVNGKGIVSERHPLSLGASIRLSSAQRWLEGRDVVLAVGTELGESDLWKPPPLPFGGRLIRIDVDPGQLDKNAAADVAVLADAGSALAALADAVDARQGENLDAVRAALRDEALEQGEPWLGLVDALAATLGDDGVLSADSTMAAYYGAVHFLPMDAAQRLVYPTGYAPLGYAVPAAIGAKLAAPERAVVALVGDGGLLFSVAELVTAAELGLPLPVVVPNNRGYGEIRDEMRARGIEPVGVDLLTPDLPRLAEALGGSGRRVQDPAALAAELRAALERPGPTLIEVPA